ncbi:helicase SRCAP-like isoform X3 [Diprion similis]|uniref:helicase SRCAP-like isoform X3 n=1 Tax=Diprion similis TaxID=362088 RepID=UPI001EF97944|nr:helicase SRCAP-like isoform X3 [Diprion similis]
MRVFLLCLLAVGAFSKEADKNNSRRSAYVDASSSSSADIISSNSYPTRYADSGIISNGYSSGLVGNGYSNGFVNNGYGVYNGGLSNTIVGARQVSSSAEPITGTVINRVVEVGVRVPHPVEVTRTVPVRVPQLVPVEYRRPVPVPVAQPVPVQVTRSYPVPVDRPVPVLVPQAVRVSYPVPVPVAVRQAYGVPVAVEANSALNSGVVSYAAPFANFNSGIGSYVGQNSIGLASAGSISGLASDSYRSSGYSGVQSSYVAGNSDRAGYTYNVPSKKW